MEIFMADAVNDFVELRTLFNRWEKPDVRIVSTDQQFSVESSSMHRHDGFELRLFFSEQDNSVPEYLEIINPKTVHKTLVESEWSRTSSLLLQPLIYRNKSRDNLGISSPFAASVEECCNRLVMLHGKEFDQCCTELRLLLALFYLKAELFPKPVNSVVRTGQMIHYLLANYYRPELSIEQLAKKFNCSPNYIQRVFKSAVRETPKQCLLRIRMEAAARFLSEGNYLVKEVAALCGFADAHYFANVFRQYYHCSPTVVQQRAIVERSKEQFG